jgi:predicted O-methyltransferase YrrM
MITRQTSRSLPAGPYAWSSPDPLFADLVHSPQRLVRVLKWKRFWASPWSVLVRRMGKTVPEADWQATLRRTAGWPPAVRAVLEQVPEWFLSDWSFALDSGWWLFDHLRRSSYRTMLECGAGLSTLLMALALRNRHGPVGPARVYSLEHDKSWVEKTRQVLCELDLIDLVRLIHAPLVRSITPEGLLFTYDMSGAPPENIDFLLIDGPPHHIGRADVVHRIRSRLSPYAVVVLDDAARRSEQQCCEAWTGRGHLQLSGFVPLGHGLAILRSGPEGRDDGPIG